MLKAVIFDFDGVIADSEPLHYLAITQTTQKFGFTLSEDLYYKDYVGYSDRECFEHLANDFPNELNKADIPAMLQMKLELFEDIARKESQIIPGVKELLQILKKHNLRTAICSGALFSDIEIMLDGSDIKDFFEIIVTADDVAKGKPDPEGYCLTLAKINQTEQKPILPSQCIVIEDSHWGLMAAKAAKMKTIAVTNTYHPEQLTIADKVVENLSHLSYQNLLELVNAKNC